VDDALRAIEAAGRVEQYAVINLGHPDVTPMHDVAEMIRTNLDADPALIRTVPVPPQITAIKRPTLDRQRSLLQFEPAIAIAEGVSRVCEVQRRMVEREAQSLLPAPSAGISLLI
jgi:nucleoside-diphosphate-sugar epimerase